MTRIVALAALAIVLSCGAVPAQEQPNAAALLIDRSIRHHDPGGVWETRRIRIEMETKFSSAQAGRFGSRNSRAVLYLAPAHGEFRYAKDSSKEKFELLLRHGVASLVSGDSASASDRNRESLLARAPGYRDYFEYLFGLPMKLRDPGTIVDPDVDTVDFAGRSVSRIRVTYEPEVGKNTWYFYFDPVTAALVGCRFYTVESKNDGEYITFEEEIVDEASGLRLPKIRAWYFNRDDSHLATDTITAMAVH